MVTYFIKKNTCDSPKNNVLLYINITKNVTGQDHQMWLFQIAIFVSFLKLLLHLAILTARSVLLQSYTIAHINKYILRFI